ncbi:MAG: ATP synthase subunit I [Marinospirillum sp.]|nr:ATP synthase subunit I [Marinospirillum sp.]
MASLPRPPYRRLLLVQLLVTGALALAITLKTPEAGISVLLGGMIAIIPQGAFFLLAFRHRGARRVQQAVQGLFAAEAVKFGLTVVLFGLVFGLVQPSNPIFLLSTYIAVVSVHWLAPRLIQQGMKPH